MLYNHEKEKNNYLINSSDKIISHINVKDENDGLHATKGSNKAAAK